LKNISIHYFAILREKRGESSESLQTECKTYRDLFIELDMSYNFDLPISIIQVAVNDEYSLMEREIVDGDKVVFIPPVAGG